MATEDPCCATPTAPVHPGPELRATGWERFSVPQFKERFGLSRKWAIPLLEHLDSIAVTRRVGDDRQLVR